MINKLKKKGNYKLIIGLIISIIFSVGMVHALYRGRADELSYDPSGTWLHSTNVQDALDELKERKGCPANNICIQKKSTLALGDYVSYTPSKTSYTTDRSMTGYSSTQTINPSELNLWRVISLNQDGTVDLISEYTTDGIYFNGLTGYRYYAGYLNTVASQFETSGITVGSRHFGYNGQIGTITDTSKFTTTAPWTCSTDGSCNPAPVESQGGGDKLYSNDYNLINSILKTIRAYRVSLPIVANYCATSRKYYYSSSTSYSWEIYIIDGDGNLEAPTLYSKNYNNQLTSYDYACSIRPIVTLKSGLLYSGVGIKDYPMEIVS